VLFASLINKIASAKIFFAQNLCFLPLGILQSAISGTKTQGITASLPKSLLVYHLNLLECEFPIFMIIATHSPSPEGWFVPQEQYVDS
jgi:hypothetical protein